MRATKKRPEEEITVLTNMTLMTKKVPEDDDSVCQPQKHSLVDGSCFRISDKTIDKSSQDHGIMNTGGPS